jgi:FtsP/CotA-like multicopper oxidase with cupredoxin domain
MWLSRRSFLAAAAGSLTSADITLRIAEASIELSPKHAIRTLTYNGQVPGPLLRMTEGKQITVEAVNETKQPEMIHWHGFHISPGVAGTHEEGTPTVRGFDRRSYTFVPERAGTRWYHTHARAGHNLNIGLYWGQFGTTAVRP